jgi:ribosomal protein S18 acetylase RimI-like enzyme
MVTLLHAARLGVSHRPMAESDFAFIEELYLASRADEVALTGWSEEQRRLFLTQQHRAQHHHYQTYYTGAAWLILERGDERIGRLYLAEWKDEIRIVDVSLMPGSRGQGIGEALLRDVAAAATASAKGVSIHVEKNNPARNLYARLGFTVAEDKGVYDLMQWGMPLPPGPPS